MDAPDLSKEDLQAALAARRELGERYEAALVESFMERLDRAVEARAQARAQAQVAERDQHPPAARGRDWAAGQGQFWLGVTSLVMGFPVTGVAGMTAGVPGVVISWAGIAAVNLAYALQARRSWRLP